MVVQTGVVFCHHLSSTWRACYNYFWLVASCVRSIFKLQIGTSRTSLANRINSVFSVGMCTYVLPDVGVRCHSPFIHFTNRCCASIRVSWYMLISGSIWFEELEKLAGQSEPSSEYVFSIGIFACWKKNSFEVHHQQPFQNCIWMFLLIPDF